MTKSRGILPPRRIWTDEEIERLRELYPNQKTDNVAASLNRTVPQVYNKAIQLGLRKTPEYLASPDACRLRKGDNVGAENRFKRGQKSWNKGLKGLDIGGKATRFKEGQMPHNTQPIGSYRITRDGTLQRKISNDKGSNSKRWRGVHELLWIEANGPVPPKHIVVFKPGQRTAELDQITLDRVECISLAENMRRNTVHNYPPEIAKTIQLIGALNRKINRRQKDEQPKND
jgi:hypothetical protein